MIATDGGSLNYAMTPLARESVLPNWVAEIGEVREEGRPRARARRADQNEDARAARLAIGSSTVPAPRGREGGAFSIALSTPPAPKGYEGAALSIASRSPLVAKDAPPPPPP